MLRKNETVTVILERTDTVRVPTNIEYELSMFSKKDLFKAEENLDTSSLSAETKIVGKFQNSEEAVIQKEKVDLNGQEGKKNRFIWVRGR